MPAALIPLRLGVQQRVLPSYRAAFLDVLAAVCAGGLGVFAGQPRAQETIESGAKLPRLSQSKSAGERAFRARAQVAIYGRIIRQAGLFDQLRSTPTTHHSTSQVEPIRLKSSPIR